MHRHDRRRILRIREELTKVIGIVDQDHAPHPEMGDGPVCVDVESLIIRIEEDDIKGAIVRHHLQTQRPVSHDHRHLIVQPVCLDIRARNVSMTFLVLNGPKMAIRWERASDLDR